MKFITALISISLFLVSCKDDEEPLYDVMYRVKGTSRYHKITFKEKDGQNVVKDSVIDIWEHGFFAKKDFPVFVEAQNLDTTGSITVSLTINGVLIDSKTETAPRATVKVEGVTK